MAPARCEFCGRPAISYRAHLLNLSATRACDSCGRIVRKRGFWTVLAAAVLVGAVVGFAVFSSVGVGSWRAWLGPVLLAALLLVVADYLAWRWLPWEPAGEEVVDTGPGPGTAERVETRENT